jgi:hypothetical protein
LTPRRSAGYRVGDMALALSSRNAATLCVKPIPETIEEARNP